MPALSAGNVCLRFPQVTAGNLSAPAGNLREAFIVRVRADFLKPRDVSFYPVTNNLTEVKRLAAFEVQGTNFKFDSVPKKLECRLLALQNYNKKNTVQ